jgi:hypothetical protein
MQHSRVNDEIYFGSTWGSAWVDSDKGNSGNVILVQ